DPPRVRGRGPVPAREKTRLPLELAAPDPPVDPSSRWAVPHPPSVHEGLPAHLATEGPPIRLSVRVVRGDEDRRVRALQDVGEFPLHEEPPLPLDERIVDPDVRAPSTQDADERDCGRVP